MQQQTHSSAPSRDSHARELALADLQDHHFAGLERRPMSLTFSPRAHPASIDHAHRLGGAGDESGLLQDLCDRTGGAPITSGMVSGISLR